MDVLDRKIIEYETHQAIGLSEETDAAVVIVSEETGAISYAYKDQLVRAISSDELRSRSARGRTTANG